MKPILTPSIIVHLRDLINKNLPIDPIQLKITTYDSISPPELISQLIGLQNTSKHLQKQTYGSLQLDTVLVQPKPSLFTEKINELKNKNFSSPQKISASAQNSYLMQKMTNQMSHYTQLSESINSDLLTDEKVAEIDQNKLQIELIEQEQYTTPYTPEPLKTVKNDFLEKLKKQKSEQREKLLQLQQRNAQDENIIQIKQQEIEINTKLPVSEMILMQKSVEMSTSQSLKSGSLSSPQKLSLAQLAENSDLLDLSERDLEKENKLQSSQINRLKEQNQALNSQIDKVNAELLNYSKMKIKNDSESSLNEIELIGQIKVLMAENKQLKEGVVGSVEMTKIEQREAQNNVLHEQALDEQKEIVRSLKSQINGYNDQLEEQKLIIQNQLDEFESFKEEIKDLKGDIKEKQGLIDILQRKQVKQLSASVVYDLQTQIEKLKQEKQEAYSVIRNQENLLQTQDLTPIQPAEQPVDQTHQVTDLLLQNEILSNSLLKLRERFQDLQIKSVQTSFVERYPQKINFINQDTQMDQFLLFQSTQTEFKFSTSFTQTTTNYELELEKQNKILINQLAIQQQNIQHLNMSQENLTNQLKESKIQHTTTLQQNVNSNLVIPPITTAIRFIKTALMQVDISIQNEFLTSLKQLISMLKDIIKEMGGKQIKLEWNYIFEIKLRNKLKQVKFDYQFKRIDVLRFKQFVSDDGVDGANVFKILTFLVILQSEKIDFEDRKLFPRVIFDNGEEFGGI